MRDDQTTPSIRRFDAAHLTDSSTPLTLSKLRRQLQRVLDRHIPRGTRVALIGFPHQGDVGDYAVWLGELEYLRQRGARIRYLCDGAGYDRTSLEQDLGNGTILLSGGGNFGDLWPGQHELRLRVIRDFPHRRIIQLPQSIQFKRADCLEETRHVLECHPRLTLLVRDRESRAFAIRKFNVELNLCPDMSFQLELIPPELGRRDDQILILTDTAADRIQDALENASSISPRAPEVRIEAWDTDSSPTEIADSMGTRRALCSRFWPTVLRAGRLRSITQQIAMQRLQAGIEQLCSSRFVVTDQLNAHILCLLLNQPHVIVENGLDQLMSFHDTWTSNVPRTMISASWKEALELACLRIGTSPNRARTTGVRRAA